MPFCCPPSCRLPRRSLDLAPNAGLCPLPRTSRSPTSATAHGSMTATIASAAVAAAAAADRRGIDPAPQLLLQSFFLPPEGRHPQQYSLTRTISVYANENTGMACFVGVVAPSSPPTGAFRGCWESQGGRRLFSSSRQVSWTRYKTGQPAQQRRQAAPPVTHPGGGHSP